MENRHFWQSLRRNQWKNGHRNMTSHVTLACTILLFLSFLLELYTKFRCVKTFWCILKVFKWFFNFDKIGFQKVWPTVYGCHLKAYVWVSFWKSEINPLKDEYLRSRAYIPMFVPFIIRLWHFLNFDFHQDTRVFDLGSRIQEFWVSKIVWDIISWNFECTKWWITLKFKIVEVWLKRG